MKRSARAAVRDPARRSLRLQLIQHDVPTLTVPTAAESVPAATGVSTGAPAPSATPPLSKEQLHALIEETVEARVQELVEAAVQKQTHTLRAALDVAQESGSKAGREASAAPEYTTEPYGQDDSSPAATSASVAHVASAPVRKDKERAPESNAGVRVVTRKSISGDAARSDAPPSLARVASPAREQSGLAARCIAHAGQHYRGATEDEVIDAWNAMRERFHLSPENKIVARRALLKWLQQSKNVCASNVHWYGDFVAVRSCGVRVPKNHPAFGTDGWFILFDPNGDAVMREPLFSEAFETPNKRYAGAVPRLGKPAWLSEERRAAAAARHGGADLRPFSPETADDLSSQDFFRGRAE